MKSNKPTNGVTRKNNKDDTQGHKNVLTSAEYYNIGTLTL